MRWNCRRAWHQACLPLLDYLAGPRSQFLTGQVLRLLYVDETRVALTGHVVAAGRSDGG